MTEKNRQFNNNDLKKYKSTSFVDAFLTALVPSLLISKSSWLTKWNNFDEENKLKNLKIFSFCIFILFTVSSIPVFTNETLQPKTFWIAAKAGTAAVFLIISFTYKFIYRHAKINGVLVQLYLGATYLCVFQALSINYRPQTAYFYVPVFAAFSTLIARLNIIASTASYLALLIISTSLINTNLVEPLHKWSISTVLYILLLYLRIRSKDEIEIFILQQESIEKSKLLIEAQKTLTDQVAAFLPKELYKRVMKDISTGLNPVSAVDNQLRPKKIVGSVLFTDIRGFTQLTKKGDDTLLKVVIPAQKSCTDIVEKNYGIPRLHGDLVHSYFDHTNQVQNLLLALRAATEIDESTKEIRTNQTESFLERYIIISYGNLLVGNLGGTNGSRDISVLGDAANIPSRIDVITKQQPLKEQLKSYKIILTEQAWSALPISLRKSANYVAFDLHENNLPLKDFELEQRIYLIKNSKSLVECLELEINEQNIQNENSKNISENGAA